MFCVQVLVHMLVIAERIAIDLGASKTNGYRVVINNELNRERVTYHPQIHVMAGGHLELFPG